MGAANILLGYGTFKIGETVVGLTRGGGQFTVEREYRAISADGDKGKVKGRVTMDTSVPKLKLSALEIISDNITSLYPALSLKTEASGKSLTGSGDITETNYETVTWTGKTKDGRAVTITVKNAVNFDNIDWSLVEKNEVVAQCTFEGCYAEGSDEEPWIVTWVNS